MMDGSGRGLIEVLSQHLAGGTEENDENFQSGYPVARPKLEPRISQTRVCVTVRPARSVTWFIVQQG
jgi:hypothetical protein